MVFVIDLVMEVVIEIKFELVVEMKVVMLKFKELVLFDDFDDEDDVIECD